MTTASASGSASRAALRPNTWIRPSSPRRSTRPRSCSPASSSTNSGAASSPKTLSLPDIRIRHGPTGQCGISDRRRIHLRPPRSPDHVHRWLGDRRGNGEALGIPDGALAATLEHYNRHAADGVDPDFHKQPEFLAPQDKGPWAAFDLSLGKAIYSGFTVGGLATTVDGAVLRAPTTGQCRAFTRPEPARPNIAQDGKATRAGPTGRGVVLR